jgi:carotenoid cleavage dioxygenase-like enzyme
VRPAGREIDGWLPTLVYDAANDVSRLDVLDARRIEERPIAPSRFEDPIPFGSHGLWSGAGA